MPSIYILVRIFWYHPETMTGAETAPSLSPAPAALAAPSRWRWLIPLLILGLAALFRFWGLKHYSQVGGDDVEFRVHIPDHVHNFEKLLRLEKYYYPRLQAPFLAAAYLSQWDVNKKVTSFAKPFFILEIGMLSSLFNLRTNDPYENIWRLHVWMAALGLATVLAVFFLARRLGGFAAGCVASFLVAVSPWAVRYSTWALHAAGGGLWFCLALLAAPGASRRDSAVRSLLFGVFLGVSVYYSVSLVWPAFGVCCFELLRRAVAAFRRFRPLRQVLLLAVFGLGFFLPPAAWEGVNYAAFRCFAENREVISRYPSAEAFDFNFGQASYLPFPLRLAEKISGCRFDRVPGAPFTRRLLETFRDNASHTGSLPADHFYFFRHLKDSDGWAALAACAAALVYLALRSSRRGSTDEGRLRLLAVFVGVAVIMNYTSGTQVARHYYSAFLLAAVITGIAAAALLARCRWAVWPLCALAAGAAALDSQGLSEYRRSRQGPYLYGLWEESNQLRGQVATLNMQQWDLWPTMTFFHDWKELDGFINGHTHPYIMYSDYIGIAHGAWFYHTKEQLGMAETFRNCRATAFACPSYLSYGPMLYENEFYYWGLFRHPSPDFDPRIKVIPAREVLRVNRILTDDPEAAARLARRLSRPPPVVIPAWKDRIILPYMDRMERPSYLGMGIATSAALLAYVLACLLRKKVDG